VVRPAVKSTIPRVSFSYSAAPSSSTSISSAVPFSFPFPFFFLMAFFLPGASPLPVTSFPCRLAVSFPCCLAVSFLPLCCVT